MVRLPAKDEVRDALSVLAADRREMELVIKTDEPLRKAKSAKHRARMKRLRDDVRAQLAPQLATNRRQAFRGGVAIELRLAAPPEVDDTTLGPMVKDYIDVLKGVAVIDDSQVEHLAVFRSGGAKPGLVEVEVRCMPVSALRDDYDRAFRILAEDDVDGFLMPRERVEPPMVDGAPNPANRWGMAGFDEDDYRVMRHQLEILDVIDELDEQDLAIEADPDEWPWVDIPTDYDELSDWDYRRYVERVYLESVALMRGSWIADQGFDARDRPGPPPSWLRITVAEDLADVRFLDDSGPGCFVFPAPPQSPGSGRAWHDEIARDVYDRLRSRGWSDIRFAGPIGFDIAIRGGAASTSDIDNVAQRIAGAFKQGFGSFPDPDGYRIYRQEWTTPEIRVRVTPLVRLTALMRSLDDARELALQQRRERTRP